MRKETARSNDPAAQAHWKSPARRSSMQSVDWKTLWRKTIQETDEDRAAEFDDEVVRLVDDCAQLAHLN